MLLKKCDTCKKEERQRNLKRVGKEWLCSKCYQERRLNHRKQTIKEQGIGEELKELRNKQNREYRELNKEKLRAYHRARYHENKPEATYYNKIINLEKNTPLRANYKKPREVNTCFLTLEEKRILFGQLIKGGMDGYQAKERLSLLVNQLKDIRDKMKLKNKSEEEIKTKQQRMIEELYASF